MNQTATEIVERQPETFREVQPAAHFEGAGLLTPELVTELEKQVELVKRARLAVCKLTEPQHWRDIGGNPYLIDAGVHAIASTIGVEFGEPKITEDRGSDEDGEFVNYTCRMSGTWRGRVLWEEGTGSSRDDFFFKSKGSKVPFKDISIGDVRKKSITNAQHRILNKITGIGGTTWELLANIGINRGAGGTTRFKGSEARMSTGSGAWSQDKQRLWGMLVSMEQDEQAASDALFKITENPQKGFVGVRDPKKLTDNQAKFVLSVVQKEFDARAKDAGVTGAQEEPGAAG